MTTKNFPLYDQLAARTHDPSRYHDVNLYLTNAIAELYNQFDRELVEYHFETIYLLIVHFFLQHSKSNRKNSHKTITRVPYRGNIVSKSTGRGVTINLDELPIALKLILMEYTFSIQPEKST